MEHVDALPKGEPPREPRQDREGRDQAGGLTMAGVTLITGASAGLGVEFARQLSSTGHRLVLAARRKDRLDALAAELGNARAVAIDLSKPGATAALMRDLEEAGEQVDILVNNAGFGLRGPFAELDAARQREMIDLNMRRTDRALPRGRARHGRAPLRRDPQRRLHRRFPAGAVDGASISRPRPTSCPSRRRFTRS